jgi:drug/metabolite transporter (DMT)-like permease
VLYRKEDSCYIRSDGTLDLLTITIFPLRALTSIIGFSLLIIVQRTSHSAGINPSVMTSLLSMTSFFVASMFYFIYNEKLKFKHLVGMLLLVLSVIMISLTNSSNENHLGLSN